MSIKLEGISKEYTLGKTTVHALTNINLEIEDGEIISIIGPSGSGKSTMLHILGALDRPTRGNISIDGISTKKMNDNQLAELRRDYIGFIFQSFNLIPALSVFSNVEFPLLLKNVGKKERKEKVLNVLESVSLLDRSNHKTEELSGGQRQRVAIARALVSDPKIVLSDEPTANLDSKTGNEILDLLQNLNEKKKVTLVFATHDAGITGRAKRVIKIFDGEVQQDTHVNKTATP